MSSYGKVDEYEQARLDASRRSRNRIFIIAISSIVLVSLVIGVIVGAVTNGNGKKQKTESNEEPISVSVKALCDVTLYKEKCIETIGAAPNASRLNPEELFIFAVNVTVMELSKVLNGFSNGEHMDNATSAAMKTCVEVLGLAVEELNDTMTIIKDKPKTEDLRTWLSSVVTYQETCIETLREVENPSLISFGETHMKNATQMSSNALAIITWLGKIADSVNLKQRRLMATAKESVAADLPMMMMDSRRLLESGDLRKQATIVVAKDGSGKYMTIGEALMEVEEKNEKPTIIYVKEGVYFENVRVEKTKWNVVMVGDGQSKTIVSAGLNYVDGTTTFQTATFAVFGKGFMARDMGFRNTAGPTKHQAVALMASADFVVFYKCTIDAFQDTLYVHAKRQFFRDCVVIGTVDFIFGNAAVVLQNCQLLPRRPLQGQQNMVTAQGRSDPNQNTGISIHNCTITPFDNLTDIQTYLGRPWKVLSRTVIMKSFIDGFINPKGWFPWSGYTAPDTIFYAEHLNFGPGASTMNRVQWKGLKTFLTENEANWFTVTFFILGNDWLPATTVPFQTDL